MGYNDPMKMKKNVLVNQIAAVLLSIVLLLSGCTLPEGFFGQNTAPEATDSPRPVEAPTPDQTAEPTADAGREDIRFTGGTEERLSRAALAAWVDPYGALSSTLFYDQLDEEHRLLYRCMLYAMETGAASFSLYPDAVYDQSALIAVYTCLASDHALVEGSYDLVAETGSDGSLTVTNRRVNGESWAKKEQAVAAGEEIAKRLQAEYAGEAELARALYGYVVKNVSYNGDAAYPENAEYLYDALIGGSSICDGYADAVCLLYRLCGIECVSVLGYIRGLGHAWNLAKIDGTYYCFDATGDAALDRSEPLISDLFFYARCTRAAMQAAGRTADDWILAMLPTCTDGAYENADIDLLLPDLSDASLDAAAEGMRGALAGGGAYAVFAEEFRTLDNTALSELYNAIAGRLNTAYSLKVSAVTDRGVVIFYGSVGG